MKIFELIERESGTYGLGGISIEPKDLLLIEDEVQSSVHNDTTEKQGGDGTNFYHLGSTEYNKVQALPDLTFSWEGTAVPNEGARSYQSVTRNTITGRLVALTYRSSPSVAYHTAYSDDEGSTWVEGGAIPESLASAYDTIQFGNGYYIVTKDGHRAVTTDLISWVEYQTASNKINRQAYFSNVFFGWSIAYSGVANNKIYRSTDNGTSYTEITTGSDGTNNSLDFAYGNGIIVGVSNGSTDRFMRSTDLGLTWNLVNKPTNGSCSHIIFDGVRFIVYSPALLYTSTDGLTWSTQAIPSYINIKTFTYGGGYYVLVKAIAFPQSSTSYISKDYINWTEVSTNLNSFWDKTIYASTKFVSVASIFNSEKKVMTSKYSLEIDAGSRNIDGGTWDSVYLPSQKVDGGSL